MTKSKPVPGVDYFPDQQDWPKPEQPPPSLLTQALVFLFVFTTLQVLWLLIRDNSVGHFIRGDLTVKPAVFLINLLTPDTHASAYGNQILAKGGGLVIKLGCEGVEAMFILIAAMVSAPLTKKSILKGILFGMLFVFVFNQIRLLILFYTFRADKSLFNLLHGTVAPLALIALAALFFYWWLHRHSNNIP